MKNRLVAGAIAAALIMPALAGCSPMEVWPMSMFQTKEQKIEALVLKIGEAQGFTPEADPVKRQAAVDGMIEAIEQSCRMSDDMVMMAFMMGAGADGVEASGLDQKTFEDAVFEMRDIVCEDRDG